MMAPVRIAMEMAQLRDENLASRAQAKLIAREIERYAGARSVHLDFCGITEIGQGFADQLFRVFANAHPDIDLRPINCNQSILAMIRRAIRTTR
ncbi:STAS-like domain-containing protein [Thiobacillus sedimenti]|uniref:STAS-like domain-containing protein n=1 Tax=Thiobacillus sedimenti TaxID=3110231 RepID=A0ABZ1CIK8_9PROT|nr:STAS-like domain-containing protein [Thiobacillus sp. SCUT-2]WRS39241.1 STAS-like domain-containing protein [Thiobacillus sp. SCUT-2]